MPVDKHHRCDWILKFSWQDKELVHDLFSNNNNNGPHTKNPSGVTEFEDAVDSWSKSIPLLCVSPSSDFST